MFIDEVQVKSWLYQSLTIKINLNQLALIYEPIPGSLFIRGAVNMNENNKNLGFHIDNSSLVFDRKHCFVDLNLKESISYYNVYYLLKI